MDKRAEQKQHEENKNYLVRRLGNDYLNIKIGDPDDIAQARKLVQDYDDRIAGELVIIKRQLKRKRESVSELIYMGSLDKALEALKDYEDLKEKVGVVE